MAEFDDDRRALAERFRMTHAVENALTAQQARLFVRSIQSSWGVQALAWTQRQSTELFGDARRLLHAAAIFEDTDGPDSEAAISCYRRAGELFEWLARARDDVTREVPPEILAAGAYQLAGFPAMATGILRQKETTGVGGVIGAFLSCDFNAVLALSVDFWRDNSELTGRDGSVQLLEAAEVDASGAPVSQGDGERLEQDDEAARSKPAFSPIAWYIAVETVRALGLIAEGLRRGEQERTGTALEKLGALADVATRWANDETWVMLRLVRAAAERFARNSLHRRAAPLAASAPAAGVRLRRFAREQFSRGRGVLWASQIRGLDRLAAGHAFALCTPTGSGKTMVANLALVKELLLAPQAPGTAGRLALYLVPSRALAGEVEAKLSAEFRGENIVITGLYGGTDWGITNNWLTTETPTVLIATVEKAEALMRYIGRLLINRLALMIIDEAHQVVVAGTPKTMQDLAAHGDRAMRLESLVSRILVLKPGLARIALTAVAGGAAPPVSRWIEDDQGAVPVGLGYRSSRQLIGVLECRPKQAPYITLELNNGQPLYVRGRETPVFLALSLPPMPDPPAGIKNSLHHYVQLHALWTAIHLAPSGRRILISVTQSPDRVMRRYSEAFNLAGWRNLARFVPKTTEKHLFDEARAACLDYCGAESSEVQLLDRGIATSHGQMPQRLRRLMVELIDKQVCPITVATATLTEGVNLPFDLIILPSLERIVEIKDNGAPVSDIIPTSEFRNLAGRAGRPGAAEAMEGLTLVCLPTANSATAASKQQEQRNQREAYTANLNRMLRLLALEESADLVVYAPLQTLLSSIWSKLRDHLGLRTVADLHNFLEQTLPETIGSNLGVSSPATLDILGDSLDEMDALIVAALDEVSRVEGLPPVAVEDALRRIWRRTFTRYASAVEEWMEAAFIKRGQAVVENLYPDPVQRRALYQLGFTPYVGRQFQLISPAIKTLLRAAADYGRRTSEGQFTLFWELGEMVRRGRGFGFTARGATETALINRWHEVAGWWLQRQGAPPPAPAELRRWQGFVSNNLEFRLGVAIGSAVAEAWNEGADELDVPSLETWRQTTNLPWIGFWFRELLRWGTLDPFVAFAMAQGIIGTREEGVALRPAFEAWLVQRGLPITDEDFIDPQLFLEWHREQPRAQQATGVNDTVPASFIGVEGKLSRYAVRPVTGPNGVIWLDPAGYQVAHSVSLPGDLGEKPPQRDYELVNDIFGSRVVRTF
ncbi:DEAD/DEAH box helicase [Rhizobium skierniewicense]|uniref:DEAD/DEAH box helicase n=1 Tax=Rhizobium skierniewicense TaxID=984260 RepID=UPI001FAB43B9|nr:DEAD/DEAH box helicase [Rhizobium skierniewicense]MCI9868656.1 DEAD/DEAH box helicase [Rhizobium skierniewicense]